MNTPATILYVDDEEPHRILFQAVFEDGYEIHTAGSAAEAIGILRRQPIHLLITDQRMPGMTGVELLAAIRDEFPDLGRMIVTAYLDIDAIVKAINAGRIDHYVSKPWDEKELRAAIDRVLHDCRRRMSQRRLVEELSREAERERRLRRAFQEYVPEAVRDELLESDEGSES
jgi:response regulator RpfG family c-di-GMP phosphodiesterase